MHFIVTDLGYGDAGKGTTVDYLARGVHNPLVVRHNGGAQAAHNVVLPDGRHHTFSQFGSGTFVPEVKTFLSEYTILNPANMIPEAEHLASLGVDDAFDRLRVAESALVVTPFHQEANRIRETRRGADRHGSCGQGIGETVGDSLKFPTMAVRVRDLFDPSVLMKKWRFWQEVKGAELDYKFDDYRDALELLVDLGSGYLGHSLHLVEDSWLDKQFSDHSVIFEGAQGVLLDETYGFFPHNTWSDTTPRNARKLLGGREAKSLGVYRSYMTRHGAGPFVSELPYIEGRLRHPELHNGTGKYQGDFRVGLHDENAYFWTYANLENLGEQLDGLVVTHVDHMPDEDDVVVGYTHPFDGNDWTPGIPGPYKGSGSTADHWTKERTMAWSQEIGKELMVVHPKIMKHTKELQMTRMEWTFRTKIILESHGPTHEDKKNAMPADWLWS